MKEAECPICKKALRSDAGQKEFCKLCGMGIADPLTSPRYNSEDGETLYFCCSVCLSIYVTQIEQSAELD
jgi:YHS domain-containing protein